MARPDNSKAGKIKAGEGWMNHNAAVARAAARVVAIRLCFNIPFESANRPMMGAASARTNADRAVICAQYRLPFSGAMTVVK